MIKDVKDMTIEELTNHIAECNKLLELQRDNKWEQLVTNLVAAAKELYNEFPHTTLRADPWCENCEERIDVDIDIELLTCREFYLR